MKNALPDKSNKQVMLQQEFQYILHKPEIDIHNK